MNELENFLSNINNFIWGMPLLIILFGTHIFLTIKLKFIQRYIITAIKISISKEKEGVGDISQFGAVTTALAATIGTGNIVGVSTAIVSGGPGAVFWMWLTGVFGIATKYSEALLSVKYRITTEDGLIAGGPMYVLERGMKNKFLAILFAAFTSITAFGIGNMVQANSISHLLNDTLNIPLWINGILLAALTASVIIGGIKLIAKVCERLVPFMAAFYIVGCIILLLINFNTIPESLYLMIKSAFTGHAVLGGFAGACVKDAIRFGIARGLFSNESGLGSAPIVAAAAQTKNPVRQALVSSTGTFWDTVVVCAFTGIVVVNSNQWTKGFDGALLTKQAFADIPVIGPILLTFGLLTFVFSTIIGWSYYGEKAIEYLFGRRLLMPYRWLWIIFVFVGSIVSLNIVWTFADITNALMAIPNLLSLIFLNNIIIEETKKYLWDGNIDKNEF